MQCFNQLHCYSYKDNGFFFQAEFKILEITDGYTNTLGKKTLYESVRLPFKSFSPYNSTQEMLF